MRIDRAQTKRLIGTVLIFAISAAEVCLLHQIQWLLALMLAATTVVALACSWEWHRALACYIFAAILGPCGEMLAVHYGAWSYPDPTCLGIPMYLPFAWGLIVVVIIGMSESVVVRE
jgi:uncharacterized membrane protein YoaT (DUF817 family)